MLRLRAVLVLLLVAAAWAPAGHAGSSTDPEVTDAAGDQAVSGDVSGIPSPVPIPGVNDDDFGDIDITAAWFVQGHAVDCVGEAPLTCPKMGLVVATSEAWTTGTLTATFKLVKGPTSYANSTAAGQGFTLTVQGTSVTGIENATASVTPDGLEVRFPVPRLGSVGGDMLTGLNLTTSRTNPGAIPATGATQDDYTGTDAAGPGKAFTMARPTPAASVDLTVARTGNRAGNAISVTERGVVDVQLLLINIGTDPDTITIAVSSNPPLQHAPSAPVAVDLPQGGTANPTVPIDLAGMKSGTIRVTFTATSARGAGDDAFANIVLDVPVADREVKPAGLDFLTPAAKSTGLDDAFGSYAELVLLALLVLLAILAVFLLVALAPSTLAGTGAAEAAPLVDGPATMPDAAPAGLLAPAAAAAPAAASAADAPPAPVAAATKAGALAIESVTHTPDGPEAGEDVRTEVLLRNPGPTRQVRVVLALDGVDIDEAAATLPARASKTVRLSWTAGVGENKVRVRVLPA